MTSIDQTAGLLFSGGQDSATCLAWALDKFDRVETIGFEYGQRHDIEMKCRLEVRTSVKENFPQWADKLGEDHVINLAGLGQISETSLTRDVEIGVHENGLPTTFVPGRNLIFLNYAAALGWRRGVSHLVAGMCEADFSGYPDCRQETLDSQMQAISLGLDRDYTLHTPLMYLSKAGAWDLAMSQQVLSLWRGAGEKWVVCTGGEPAPRDDTYLGKEEKSDHSDAAFQYCLANPIWRLSVQTHKSIGVP